MGVAVHADKFLCDVVDADDIFSVFFHERDELLAVLFDLNTKSCKNGNKRVLGTLQPRISWIFFVVNGISRND